MVHKLGVGLSHSCQIWFGSVQLVVQPFNLVSFGAKLNHVLKQN